jgi:hypothetical protein
VTDCCCEREDVDVLYDDHPGNTKQADVDNDLHQLYLYPDHGMKCLHCNREWDDGR